MREITKGVWFKKGNNYVLISKDYDFVAELEAI